MRESLTILAVALILVLSALLVGPYLINWNSQRDFLAAKLSDAIGATVRIAGPIDVKLLPRPIFRASQVTIAGKTATDPRFSAATFDAELSINGLLQGAVEFVDATVVAPRLDLTQQADGSIAGTTWDLASPHKFKFNQVRVVDGTLVVHDPVGKTRFAVTGIAAHGEADTLLGPAKVNGTATGDEGPVAFRLNTGAFVAHRLRIKFAVTPQSEIGHAEADGNLVFPGASGTDLRSVRFEGSLGLAGSVHVADGASPVPWRLAATGITADAQELKLPALELRAGADERAFVANGAASAQFGPKPTAAVQLRSRQLDLDRITVPPEVAPDTPRPTAAQWVAKLRELAGTARLDTPLALSLDLGVDAITQGDLVLTGASAVLDARPDAPLQGRVAIAGPEASRLALAGTFETGAAPGFKGQGDLATRNLPAVAALLQPVWPAAASALSTQSLVSAVDFKGGLDLSGVGFAARDMTLSLDGSTLTGTLSMTAGVGQDRPRLFADVSAERLDAERLPDLTGFVSAVSPLDLSIGVRAKAAKLSSAGVEPVEVGQLGLHLTKAGDTTTLDRLSIEGLGGANLTATASLDANRALRAQGHVQAGAVASLATVLHQLLPNASTDLLLARAPALSPMNLNLKLDGAFDTDAAFTPRLVSAQGTAGPVRLSATITPEPAQKYGTPTLNAMLVADAADAGAALRQWGVARAGPLGAGHVETTARGTLDAGFDTTTLVTIPDAKATFAGRVQMGSGFGHLKASGTNAATLARAAGLAAAMTPVGAWDGDTDLTWDAKHVGLSKLTMHGAGATASGTLAYGADAPASDPPAPPILTGSLRFDTLALPTLVSLALGPPATADPKPGSRWSSAPFAPMPVLPRADLALQVTSLTIPSETLVARDAAMTLRLGSGSVALADLKANVAGGTVGGTVTLRRDGPAASLSGTIGIVNVALAFPSFAGRLSTTLDLAGSGISPDALVASLGGQGTVALAGVSVPKFDPTALGRVAKAYDAYDASDASTDDDATRAALQTALDKGPLQIGDVAAPATIAAGTLRVTGLQSRTAGATAVAATAVSEGAFDLRNGTLALKTTIQATEPPKEWTGDLPQVTALWSGPPGTPTRTLDAASFVNGLAARAIARDQARIELMQDDVRERAFFARRLRAIEAEQQAKRDAERIEKMAAQADKTGPLRGPRAPDGTATTPAAAAPGSNTAKAADAPATMPLPPIRRVPAVPTPLILQPVPAVPTPTIPSDTDADPAKAGVY